MAKHSTKGEKGGEVGGKKRDKSIVTSSVFTMLGRPDDHTQKWGVHVQT